MIQRLTLCSLLVLLFPWPAQAFVLATDVEDRPLRWAEPSELRFVAHLPEVPCDDLPPGPEIMAAIARAAESWSLVDGAAVSIQVEEAPPGASTPVPGFDRDDPEGNVNAVIFETDVWRHQPGAFAVTLRTYGSSSAHLLHADIVVNAVEYRWEVLESPSPPDPDGAGPVDLQGVLTHEIGHALGFEHTTSNPSAMRSTVGFGEIWMRELSFTDEDGLRYLYPLQGRGPGSSDDPEIILAEAMAAAGCSAAPAKDGLGIVETLALLSIFAFPLLIRSVSRSCPNC